MLLQFVLCCVHSFFDAVAQRSHDGEVNLAFAHAIFNARVDTRVVVDFDDYRVTMPFLKVNAVKPVANQAANLEGGLHDSVRHHLDGDAFALTRKFFALLVVAFPVVDLPVALGHVVFAGVKRFAVEHAHAPVEFRRCKFLVPSRAYGGFRRAQ